MGSPLALMTLMNRLPVGAYAMRQLPAVALSAGPFVRRFARQPAAG